MNECMVLYSDGFPNRGVGGRTRDGQTANGGFVEGLVGVRKRNFRWIVALILGITSRS
jgi:hypothetical protein